MADLDALVLDIERHLAAGGWGQPPRLYALVRTGDLLATEPQLRDTLGDADPDSLTPVEQDDVAEDVADLLPRIVWPPDVVGAALAHEIVMVPDEVDAARPDGVDPALWALEHEHEDLRAVAAVLRTGESSAAVRVRGRDGAEDSVVVDATVVPNMVAALRQTLSAD